MVQLVLLWTYLYKQYYNTVLPEGNMSCYLLYTHYSAMTQSAAALFIIIDVFSVACYYVQDDAGA